MVSTLDANKYGWRMDEQFRQAGDPGKSDHVKNLQAAHISEMVVLRTALIAAGTGHFPKTGQRRASKYAEAIDVIAATIARTTKRMAIPTNHWNTSSFGIQDNSGVRISLPKLVAMR